MNPLTSFEADGQTPVYFRTARQHEGVFRDVLEIAKSGEIAIVPREVDLSISIEALLKICNPYRSEGRFSVEEFYVGPRGDSKIENLIGEIGDDKVILSAGNIATLMGKSGIYEFSLVDDQVSFSQTIVEMQS